MKFKNVLIESEWNKINFDLKIIVSFLDIYIKKKYGVDIVITCLMRSQTQQDLIYKDDPKYKIKPWQSVHQYGRGCDVRCRDWTQEQINEALNILNLIPYDEKHLTAIAHRGPAECADHIHIQVKG